VQSVDGKTFLQRYVILHQNEIDIYTLKVKKGKARKYLTIAMKSQKRPKKSVKFELTKLKVFDDAKTAGTFANLQVIAMVAYV